MSPQEIEELKNNNQVAYHFLNDYSKTLTMNPKCIYFRLYLCSYTMAILSSNSNVSSLCGHR